MTGAVAGLTPGEFVRVAYRHEDEREAELGKIGYAGDWMSYVHLADGDSIVAENTDLTPVRFQDPTGLTTGRWRVRRRVLITVSGLAQTYVFRAEPIPARGVHRSAIEKDGRDFPRFDQAIAYANERAARNLR